VSGPVVFVLIVGFALFVFFLSRQSSTSASDAPMHDPDWRPEALQPEEEEEDWEIREPGVVGKEIPFPFDIRELEQKYGPELKRPRILNYYFKTTDLIEGPQDPENFVDEFFVEFENPDDDHRWTSTNTIVTPRGISNTLAETADKFLYGDGMIIVPRYDLAMILRAVIELQLDVAPKPSDARFEDQAQN
jgi:hypothetical protein